MKKRSLFALGVAVLLLFSLVGCGAEPTAPDEPTTPPTTTTTTVLQEEIVLDASDSRFADLQEFLNKTEILIRNSRTGRTLLKSSKERTECSIRSLKVQKPIFPEKEFL